MIRTDTTTPLSNDMSVRGFWNQTVCAWCGRVTEVWVSSGPPSTAQPYHPTCGCFGSGAGLAQLEVAFGSYTPPRNGGGSVGPSYLGTLLVGEAPSVDAYMNTWSGR